MSMLDFMLTKTANEGQMPPQEPPPAPEETATAEDVADQVDLTQLSDEELEELKQTAEAIQEGDESAPSPEEEQMMNAPPGDEALTEEDAAKIAQATIAINDLSGRAMAHAFHSEWRKIAEEEKAKAEGKEDDSYMAKKKKEEAEKQEKTAAAGFVQQLTSILMDYYG